VNADIDRLPRLRCNANPGMSVSAGKRCERGVRTAKASVSVTTILAQQGAPWMLTTQRPVSITRYEVLIATGRREVFDAARGRACLRL
jgi:hypothetical protein